MRIRDFLRRDVALLTLVSALFAQTMPVYAKPTDSELHERSTAVDQLEKELNPAEFVMRNYPEEALISVKLMGGVTKPGVYHLPKGTTLTTAIALAGGLTNLSEYDNVWVSSLAVGGFQQMDMREIMKPEGRRKDPVLQPNDMILVKESRNAIHPDTLALVTIVAALAGILLSAVTVRQILTH